MKAAGLLEELSLLLKKRSNISSLYDSECDKFKSSRDAPAFNNALKKLNGDYNAATTKVLAHQEALVKEDPEIADKVCLNRHCYQLHQHLVTAGPIHTSPLSYDRAVKICLL